LVVDDNEDNRLMLTARLARLGYKNVTTANDGREALDLIGRRPFDLVLLDIMMPELNGYQVLERLRADGKLTELPVIVVSALTEMESVIRCIELGAEDYLPKPINAILLKARVGACLEKKQFRDQARDSLERLERELDAAREIQLGMVPTVFPAPTPERPIELFATLEPARQVGGDLYDVFYTDDGVLCFVVADVSDKGAPAALFMARTKTLIRLVATLARGTGGGPPEPAEVIAQVNIDLCRENRHGMFVTLFLGMLDPVTGALRYCNAGHGAPYVLGAAGAVPLTGGKGKPVGIRPTFGYVTAAAALAPGDGLFLYTDGITEAMDPDGALFSEERLEETLRLLAGKPPDAVVGAVMDAVRAFSGAAPQSDDIAALALRRVE
jgi:sigma-B regulation protein RsbU (phosphoserine phosphatase)